MISSHLNKFFLRLLLSNTNDITLNLKLIFFDEQEMSILSTTLKNQNNLKNSLFQE